MHDLLRVFANPKYSKIEKQISVINMIGGGSTYKPRGGFLEENQRLISLFGLVIRLGACCLIVFIVAMFYSYVFAPSISSMAPYMLTATFALFAAWEFKSK